MAALNPRNERIRVDACVPNTWNPNRMSKKMLAKLKKALAKYGSLVDIIVRPHPVEAGKFEIIDGFHRWTLATEFGDEFIDAKVVAADDRTARMLGPLVNDIGGENVPEKLGALFAELAKEQIEDVVDEMPWDESEIRLLLDLSAHAWDPNKTDLGGERSNATDDWVTIKARVPKGAQKVIEKAIKEVANDVKAPVDVRRGIALERLAADYLAGASQEPKPAPEATGEPSPVD